MRIPLPIRAAVPGRLAGVALPLAAADSPAGRPPAARTEDIADSYGGVSVRDPYRRLEERASRETRARIDAQNACASAALGKLPGREALRKRLAELLKVATIGGFTLSPTKQIEELTDELSLLFAGTGAAAPAAKRAA